MIICNNCGNIIEDGKSFCAECGTLVSMASDSPAHPLAPALPTQPLSAGPMGVAPAPAMDQISVAPLTQPISEPESALISSSASQRNMKLLIAGIVSVAVIAITAVAYLALQGSPAARVAASLKSAVANGRLVTMSNDDAYSYYLQLKTLDPSHSALREMAEQVLPKLRSMGDEVFRKKVTVNTEKPSDQEWTRMVRVYEWARQLEPNDKKLEARWKFSEGEVAKSQKRIDEADRNYSAAAQIDSSWALPQNSLGLLRSESRRWADAVPYYRRAVELQPEWEIPYNNMGTAYFYLKDYDTAEQWYKTAIDRNPNWARPHYWLGSIYQQKSWKADAITQYQAALSLDTNGNSITADERNQIEKRIAQLQR